VPGRGSPHEPLRATPSGGFAAAYDRPAFRQAIALGQRHAAQRSKAPRQIPGQRIAAGNAYFQGRKVGMRDRSALDQGPEHCRHADQHRDAVMRDRAQRLSGLEAGQNHKLAAEGDGEIHHRCHAEAVAERQNGEKTLRAGFGAGEPGAKLCGIDGKVPVREQNALGSARGPAGVLDHRRLGHGLSSHQLIGSDIRGQRLEIDDARIVRRLRHAGVVPQPKRQVSRKRQHAGHPAGHDAAQPRPLQQRGDPSEQGLQIDGDHDVGLRILDLADNLSLGGERIEVHDRAAGRQGGEVAQHAARRVRQAQPDPRPGLDPQASKPLRRMPDQRRRLSIRGPPAIEIEKRAIRICQGGGGE
jgi:hypothetical protein